MKNCVFFLSCFVWIASLQAQFNNQIFTVNGSCILADTNGHVLINQRFEAIRPIDARTNLFAVRKNSKFGVFFGDSLIYGCDYREIEGLYLNRGWNAFTLKQNGKWALGDKKGIVHSGFEWDEISKFEDESEFDYLDLPGRLLTFRKGLNKLLYLYTSKDELKPFMSFEVNAITYQSGFFIFRTEKKYALFQYDKLTAQLKEIRPFSENTISFAGSSFYKVYDVKTQETSLYNFAHKKVNAINRDTEYFGDAEVGRDFEPADVSMEPETLSFKSLQNAIANVYFDPNRYLVNQFREDYSYAIYDMMHCEAKVRVTGNPGKLQLDVHFNQPRYSRAKDTTFFVEADEILNANDDYLVNLIVRKGNEYGVINTFGKVVLPFEKVKIEQMKSKTSAHFIIVRDKKKSKIYFHNPLINRTGEIYEGIADDVFTLYKKQIFIQQKTKNRTNYGMIYWMEYSRNEQVMKTFKTPITFKQMKMDRAVPFFTFVQNANGKYGFLQQTSSEVVPCIYDTVSLNLVYAVDKESMRWGYQARTTYLQPVVIGQLADKKVVYSYDAAKLTVHFNEFEIPATKEESVTVTGDGNFVLHEKRKDWYEVYSLVGKKLTQEPIQIVNETARFAEYNDNNFYLVAKTTNGQEILLTNKGVVYELPLH